MSSAGPDDPGSSAAPAAADRCASCGGTLTSGARFCPGCGASVVERPSAKDPVRTALSRALGTRFAVERLLGRGGMGAVYLAHETGLDREVAVKVLPPDRAESAEARERFRREARTAARLTHPGIVPLFAFGEQDGMPYYVMGYVPGESLAGRLARTGPLPEEEARPLLAAVAEALHHAHEHGVVHRDVKPDNILVEEQTGRPLLTDFGIARATVGGDTLTSTGSVVGSPGYMSPEQASGSATVDARSDIYSFGVTAYAVLAGRPPFQGGSAADLLRQHLTASPPPLEALAPGVSPDLAAAVMRCLAKDPRERWPDAAALARAIAGTGPDPELPDVLAEFEYSGLGILAWAAVTAVVGVVSWLVPHPHFLVEIGAQVGLAVLPVMLLGVGFRLWNARRSGFGVSAGLGAVFRQPQSWKTWYPRRFRRADNAWDRLPAAVRRARWARMGMIVGAILSAVFMFLLLQGVVDGRVRAAARAVAGLLALIIVGSLPVFVVASRHLKRAGFTDREISRLLMEEPLSGSTFWARPAIAALLTPPRAGASRASTGVAAARSGVERRAAVLDPLHPELAARLRAEVTRLATVVREAESALPRLRAELDAADEADLRDRLEKLGPAREGEPVSRARMRDLLAGQLELARDLARQHAHAERARADAARALSRLAERLALAGDDPGRLAAEVEALLVAPANPTVTRTHPTP